MTVYLDTSVVLRVLLGQADSYREWGTWERAFASDLLQVEFFRTIDRLRLNGDIGDAERIQLREEFDLFWATCHQVPLSTAVLRRASEPFPTVVGSLDALHLATALKLGLILGEAPVFVTHDQQLSRAARAMGLELRPR